MTEQRPPSTNDSAADAAQAAAAIERAVDAATERLTTLAADVAAREARIDQLQEICDERKRVIDELFEHAETYRRAAEERAALVSTLDFQLERLREDLASADRERTDALAAAASSTRVLDEERARARLTAAQAQAEVRDARRQAESLQGRIAILEAALEARTTLIEELQAACDARLAAIDTLTDEVAALRLVAEERRLLLEGNDARYRAREAELAARPSPGGDVDWRGIAEKRERALREVTVEAERRAVLLAEVTAALEGKTQEMDDLRKRLKPTS